HLVAAPQARGNRAATAVPPHRARSRRQAQRPPMRLRIILLVMATSSLVLVSFLVPLALVLRTLAADRAVSSATVQARWMATLVATLGTDKLGIAVAQVNAQARTSLVTVFLPSGETLGPPAPRDAAVRLAARGRSFTTAVPGGVEVLVAVQGLAPEPASTAVIRTFVPDAQLRHRVTRAWQLLGCVGLGWPCGAFASPARSRGPWCARWPGWPGPATGWPPETCRPGRRWPGRPRCAGPARA